MSKLFVVFGLLALSACTVRETSGPGYAHGNGYGHGKGHGSGYGRGRDGGHEQHCRSVWVEGRHGRERGHYECH